MPVDPGESEWQIDLSIVAGVPEVSNTRQADAGKHGANRTGVRR